MSAAGLGRAALDLGRILLLLGTLVAILIPRPPVGFNFYPLVLGIPLVWLALARRKDRAFLLWTAYVLSFVAFVVLRVTAGEIGGTVRFAYAIELDRVLFLGAVPTEWLQRRWYGGDAGGWIDLLLVGVYLSYFIVPHATAILCWLRKRAFGQYVFALGMTYAIGIVVHAALPTAPPWMALEAGHLESADRIVERFFETRAPGVFEAGTDASGNDVAAMPSIHTAVTAVVAAAWFRLGAGRLIGVLYCAAMALALVYLGEHYAVDVIAGVLAAAAAWYAVDALARVRAGRSVPAEVSRPAVPAADRG